MDWSAAALMVAALGNTSAEPSAIAPMQFAQLTIRREIMLRIPIQTRPSAELVASKPAMSGRKSAGPNACPHGPSLRRPA
jgi:hypothetical protein